MRNRSRYQILTKVSFWLTVALIYFILIVVPFFLGGIWLVLYLLTVPMAWNYGKYIKENYKDFFG